MRPSIKALGAAATSDAVVAACLRRHLGSLDDARALLEPEPPSAPLLDGLFAALGDPDAPLARPDAIRAALVEARVPIHFRTTYGVHAPDRLDEPLREALAFWLTDLPEHLLPRLPHPELPPAARARILRAAILFCADRRIPCELCSVVYRGLAGVFVALDGRLSPEERLSVLHCDDHGRADDLGLPLGGLGAEGLWGGCWDSWWGQPEARDRLGVRYTAQRGEEALEALRERPHSLFITDEQHFGPTGGELALFARTQLPAAWSSEMSILLVTGFALRPEWRELGLDGYFSKPFRVRQLMAAYSLAVHDPRHLLALERNLLAQVAARA